MGTAQVDLKSASAAVEFDGSQTNVEALCAAVTAAGYPTTTTSKVTLQVKGMMCTRSCTPKVTKTLSDIPGVITAQVDLKSASAAVEFDGSQTNVEALCAAVTAAGYPTTLPESESTASVTDDE